MNKLYLIIACILLAVVISCCTSGGNNERELTVATLNGDITLQERSDKLPKVVTLPLTTKDTPLSRTLDPDGGIIGNSDILLGYSYTVGNSIIGDYTNVKFPVIDLAKVKAKGNSYITAKRLNYTTTYSFSYSNLEKYESNSQVARSVKTGVNLNLGIFKIGRSIMLSQKFNSCFSSEKDVVYGELNVEVRDSQFELNCTNEKLRVYASQCLSPSFQADLYRGTIGNIINSYGSFVLRSYITGVKATALYAGESKNEASSSVKETNLNTDIHASFAWQNNSVDGSLTFGNGSGSGNSRELRTQNTVVSIQTYGGSLDHQVTLEPSNLKELSINLSPWLKSAKDRNLHTIIDVTSGVIDQQRGLYPLCDFFLEKNFKQRFYDTSVGFLESLEHPVQPKIEIVKVFARQGSNGEALYEIAAVLTTRQGDKIVLSDGEFITAPDEVLKSYEDSQIMKQKVKEIYKKKKVIFQGLGFFTNYSTTYNPAIRIPLCLRLDQFKEEDMALFVDPKSNMHYIYSSSSRIALSYFFDEEFEDSVLDFYGIRSWVESLPRKKVSTLWLHTSCTIIGL